MPQASTRIRPVFKESASCRDYIAGASCDAAPSEVTPESAIVLMSLWDAVSWAALSNGGGTRGISLYEVPGCGPPDRTGEMNPESVPGTPCFVSPGACADDLYCRASEPHRIAGSHLCGVCESPQAISAPCDETMRCASDALCDSDICRALGTSGESCGQDADCSNGACVAGICAAIGHIGDPCDSNADCETDICSKAGVCAAVSLLDLGEPCGLDYVSTPDYCDRDRALTCIDETCVPISDVGGPCEASDDCRLGLVCHGGVCTESACPIAPGDPCDNGLMMCNENSYCDLEETMLCQPRSQEGTSCQTFDQCAEGLSCRSSGNDADARLCTAPRENGSPCTSDSDCRNSYCQRDNWSCEIVAPEITVCQTPPCEDCGTCAEAPTVVACD